ncbi:MAG: DUF58 domain-containing protein [Pirellulales bacterium]
MSEFFILVESWVKDFQQLPILVFLTFALPLLGMARWLRTYPTQILAFAFVVPCALSLLIIVGVDTLLIALTIDIVFVAVGLIDLVRLPLASHITIERKTLKVASLKKKHRVTLTVSNKSSLSIRADIRDDIPQEFVAGPEEFDISIAARSRSTVHYEFESTKRGAFQLNCVHVRIRSPWLLWQKIIKIPLETVIRVYPDMKQLGEYALLARTNRLSLMGVRRTRKVGQDHDFERLRDYTLDDNYKHIDWRTTARRRKLTVKDFQTSQSQRIIFMIDCGRMMSNEADGISLLDHALNAMLMLGYVALRQGDSVGAICFSDKVHSYVPPRTGANHMNQLLHSAYDQFPSLVESRYDEAFMHLRTNCRKRSLVVLISNVIDEVNAHQVEQYLSTLVGRHLPLGVLMRDHRLFDAVETEKMYGSHLFKAAAAAEILSWRHQVLTDLTHKGVMAMDVFPEDLTANLVNQYLEIKARHLL